MKALSVAQININAPYKVWKEGKRSTDYIAMIVPRSHPQLDEIVNRFNEEVNMFNELKP